MTIAITSSGIALDGPLVAGEKVAVTVSGLSLAAEDKPTLALLARFPDALLASVELAEDTQTPGTWTGELDTATKQTALFFATARADERRDAALELVAGRVSLARLTVPMANSALCPKPDGAPFASPVYVPVPGPPGTGGDPYDQPPEMDGEASAGTADEYARGNHRHPTDTTRQAVIEDLAAIRSGAAAGATAVQPAALSAYRTASAQDAIDGAQNTAIAAKYTKPASGIPASDLASGVLPTALPNPHPLHVGCMDYDGSTEVWTPGADTNGGYGIVTLESVTNSTNADGYAATPLAVKTVADSVAEKATATAIAPAFSSSSTYAVGDYVTHEGLLYKCTTAVSTAGAWNAAKWTAVAVTDEMGSGAAYYEIEYLESTGTQYIDTGVTAGLGVRVVAEMEWAPITINGQAFGSATHVGSYSNRFFLCVAPNGTPYVAVGAAASFIDPSTSAVAASTGVRYTYDCSITASTATLFINGNSAISQSGSFSFDNPQRIFIFARNASGTAEGFSQLKLYSLKIYSGGTLVRDYIPVRSGFDGGLLDRVTGAIFGNAGSGAFVLGQDVNPPVPTDSPAFTGTPTAPTAAAGTNTTQIATTAFVQTEARYALTAKTPSVSGTAATVACEDRAINDFTVATGITSLTITPPAAVTGRARDFFCRVTLTDSSLPTVTLSGGTIDIGAMEVAGMTQGVNLLMFTEIASGHWLASRRSAS